MAFDGVLTPESASFAGQAAISRPLACQNTPAPVPGPISLSGTAGPAACGETGMVGPESEPLDRRALGRGRNSVSANRPSTCTPLARRAAAPCEAGRRGAGARTALSAGGASLPNVIHWGWRGAPAPSNPDPGDLSPGPPITPAAPFCLSHDGGLDGARSDSDGGDAAFRGCFRPQRRGLRPLREGRCA